MTYLALNAAGLALVLVACATVLWRVRPRPEERRELGAPVLLAAAVLFALTAVFDSLIIAAGIVAYDESRILGLRVGTAPIEDFAYTIAVGAIVPTAWVALGRRRGTARVEDDGRRGGGAG